LLLVANEQRDAGLGGGEGEERFRGPVMTASLAIKYERPVPTPGVVLARVVLEGVEGGRSLLRGRWRMGRGGEGLCKGERGVCAVEGEVVSEI
jgi:hypothetical protein